MFRVKPYSQIDPRWKDKKLGDGTGEQETIGYIGCLMTCVTMVATGFGRDETPATFNDHMLSVGGFAGSGIRVPAVSKLYPEIRQRKRLPDYDPPAPLAEIDEHLSAGLPAIVKVKYPVRGGFQDHWVLLIDKQGDDYLVQDPFPIRDRIDPVPLSTTSYGKLGRPQEVIRAVILMEGPNGAQTSIPLPAAAHSASPTPAAPAPTQKPVPAGALVVYATGDELAIRRKPVIARETLIKRIPVKSKLAVLELPETAKYKVGQGSTWLEVQTEDGTQGFVAAWFVSLDKPVIPAAPPQPSPAQPPAIDANTLVVYAASDGRLALRRLPVISNATLIRWVPQNTEFAVLESADQARKKIGAPGQWLNVRDVRGTQGYVSAQYVSTSRIDPAVKVLLADAQPKVLAAAAGDTGKLVVRSTTEGLALRRQPFVSSTTLIKREPLNAELLVLEPLTGAEGLIGQYNRWLKVRDIKGAEGYVAAWYVAKTPQPVVNV